MKNMKYENKSNHMVLSFKSYFKHSILKVAEWLRGIASFP